MPATTIDWASIILPITPPELLAAAARSGEKPSCFAVTCCRFPNRTFDEVSLPVSATPSQPRSGEKKGKSQPVLAKASPMVESRPPKRVVKPRAIMAAIVTSESCARRKVPAKMRTSRAGERRRMIPEMIPVRSRAVPVAESQLKVKRASSAFSASTTGGARKIALSR